MLIRPTGTSAVTRLRAAARFGGGGGGGGEGSGCGLQVVGRSGQTRTGVATPPVTAQPTTTWLLENDSSGISHWLPYRQGSPGAAQTTTSPAPRPTRYAEPTWRTGPLIASSPASRCAAARASVGCSR